MVWSRARVLTAPSHQAANRFHATTIESVHLMWGERFSYGANAKLAEYDAAQARVLLDYAAGLLPATVPRYRRHSDATAGEDIHGSEDERVLVDATVLPTEEQTLEAYKGVDDRLGGGYSEFTHVIDLRAEADVAPVYVPAEHAAAAARAASQPGYTPSDEALRANEKGKAPIKDALLVSWVKGTVIDAEDMGEAHNESWRTM